MSEVLHQYVVTKTGEQWCVFDCVGTLPHNRGERPPDDVTALRKLAQDFEVLMDPARDDMHHLYDWTPPEWWDTDRRFMGENQEVTGLVIEVRNLLHRVANRLEADQ